MWIISPQTRPVFDFLQLLITPEDGADQLGHFPYNIDMDDFKARSFLVVAYARILQLRTRGFDFFLLSIV